jgi:hypothetical protein
VRVLTGAYLAKQYGLMGDDGALATSALSDLHNSGLL